MIKVPLFDSFEVFEKTILGLKDSRLNNNGVFLNALDNSLMQLSQSSDKYTYDELKEKF